MLAPNPVFDAPREFGDLFTPACVDIFAGCGGWSTGAEQAFADAGWVDRKIDLMINHWLTAVAVHTANHPLTDHMRANVLEVHPDRVLLGRRIRYVHLSPDCTDHSKAKGGKPRRKEIRALADVGIVWARHRRPDVITLENVEEFEQWGPLGPDGQPDKARRGHEFKRWKGELEALGYVVEHRVLRACDYGAPTTRRRLFVIARCDGKPIVWPAKTHGPAGSGLLPYLTAADCIDWTIPMLSIFASPDEAKAFAKYHGGGVPRRPLKAKTLARIAGGLDKFVIKAAKPFIVTMANGSFDTAPSRILDPDSPFNTVTGCPKHAAVDVTLAPFTAGCGGRAGQSPETAVTRPLPTVTGKADRVVASAVLAPYSVPRYGERDGQPPRSQSIEQPAATITGTGNGSTLVAATLTRDYGRSTGAAVDQPAPTMTGMNHTGLVAALVTKHYGGVRGSSVDEPLHTVTACDHNAVSVAYLSHFYTSNSRGGEGDPLKPAKTIASGGQHAAVTVAMAAPYMVGTGGATYAAKPVGVYRPANTVVVNDRRAIVAAFLAAYYGEGSGLTGHSPADPLPTATGTARFGLVTVTIDGTTYVVTDIAMRMLTPRELANAQGFPSDYVIDRTADGKPVSKADQVKLIGNAVPPAFARAIVKANVVDQGVLGEPPKAKAGKAVAA